MKKTVLLLLLTLNIYAAPKGGDQEVAFRLPKLFTPQTYLDSKKLHNKITLLNIWASWCSGCQAEMPLFVKLQQAFDKKTFEVILVNIDNNADNARDFLNNVDPQNILTALYDQKKKLPQAYQCPGMPTSILIDKQGKIVKIYVGSLDAKEMLTLQKTIISLVREK